MNSACMLHASEASMSSVSPSTRRDRVARRAPDAADSRAVTVRAVALGLALVPPLCWWSAKNELIHGGTEMIEASLVVIAVFTLFGPALLNEALRRRAPRLTFSRGELLTTYAMLTTSLGIARLGAMQVLPQQLGGAATHFVGARFGTRGAAGKASSPSSPAGWCRTRRCSIRSIRATAPCSPASTSWAGSCPSSSGPSSCSRSWARCSA